MKENKTSISGAQSYEEIGEFWDSHDLDDYWDQTHPAEFDVEIKRERPDSAKDQPVGPLSSSLTQPTNPVEVFYSYAHEDEPLQKQLVKHLANLKRQGIITNWYDRDITAGSEWNGEIRRHLDSAKVILLLISPDFMSSDYCNNIEVRRAMERHDAREARVIPVILRPVDWEGTPFSKLQAFPTDALPVTSWTNADEAFLSVAKAIRKALKELTEGNDPFTPANIPRPSVVGFVARRDSEGRDIVNRLTEELAPNRTQLIALSGPGGVGKTTVAAETAKALFNDFRRRLVWTSALGREGFALSNFLDDIATQLGRAELRPLKIDQKVRQVQTLIAEAPVLIVLDNFETISEAEQTHCAEFLADRASCPALITSRQRIELARNVAIPVLSRSEADEFLKRLIEQASDPSVFEQLDRDRVYTASDRNPLVLQWVVAQIDLAQDTDTVLEELSHGQGDAAQRVFDRSFGLAQLGDDGRATLMALSLFAPDASRLALAEVAGFSGDLKRLNQAVKRLAGLWLIKAAALGQRLLVEGLTRQLAKARLSKDKGAVEFRERFVAYFLGYAKAHAQPTPEDYEALEEEKDNLLGAMDVAFEMKDWDTVTALAYVIALPTTGVLDVHGYWDEALKRNEQALRTAREISSERDISNFAHNQAVMHQYRGEVEEARQLYNQSLEIKKRLDNQGGIASTLHQLAMLAQHQGELEEARELYNESLEIKKRLDNQGGIASTLHQLAMLAQDQGELDEARELYNQSLEINKRLGDQSRIAITLHELGRLAQNQGELEEARELYRQSLEINKKLGNQSGIAGTLHQLAMLAENQGELEEAWQLYNQSLDINKKLGNQSDIASTLHQLGSLSQAQGELDEARRLYEQSMEINKKLGNQNGIALTLGQLGLLSEDVGNMDEATRLFREALAIFEKLGSPDADIARRSLARVEGKSS
jgi:tetratricopeptide (TPR) repeat protein